MSLNVYIYEPLKLELQAFVGFLASYEGARIQI